MKFKKKILFFMSSLLLVPTLLIGCGKKDDIKIVNQEEKKSVLQVSVVYDESKATTELLTAELEKIKEDKDLMKENKALVVKFYETEDEAFFSDVIPYAVGFWGPETGLNSAYNQISSKNNETYIEFSTPKDVDISSEDEENIVELLKELRVEDNGIVSLQQQLIIELMNNEDFILPADEAKSLVDKILTRYEDDAVKNVLLGNLE